MNTVTAYFNAERAESLLFIAVGAIALAFSAWCMVVHRKPFFLGMATTLALVAVLQLVVGGTIFQRSPEDTARVQQMLQSAPDQVQAEEVPRMRVVMNNFKIYLGVELALLILILIVMVLAAQGSFLRGAAVGLALQALFTAVLDLTATRRGDA